MLFVFNLRCRHGVRVLAQLVVGGRDGSMVDRRACGVFELGVVGVDVAWCRARS